MSYLYLLHSSFCCYNTYIFSQFTFNRYARFTLTSLIETAKYSSSSSSANRFKLKPGLEQKKKEVWNSALIFHLFYWCAGQFRSLSVVVLHCCSCSITYVWKQKFCFNKLLALMAQWTSWIFADRRDRLK